jgi:mannitol-1-/sugar-/sorbitol-6-phosphatase
VSAYLCDLDGVLVDSLAVVERTWRWWAGSHGLDPEAFVNDHGRTTLETIARLAPDFDAQAEAKRIEEHEVNEVDGLRALPGAATMLGRPEPVAVVTSGGRRLAEARLRASGLPIPRVLISADAVRRGKPDPEPYLLAASALEVSPAECIVFEDSPAGVRAGRAAGMHVVALTTTLAASELTEADEIVANLDEYLVGSPP